MVQLRQEILRMQGQKPATDQLLGRVKLGPVLQAFPQHVFPTGAVHECITTTPATTAATTGFIAGILSGLMQGSGPCIWISSDRMLFPPGFSAFGLEPDRILFVHAKKEKDICWAMETCLQMDGLSAVVSELPGLDFTISRRLQLAVEKSGVTGFVLRTNRNLHPTACVSRWQIHAASSYHLQSLPGVTLPSWNVELLKVRGGSTGSWQLVWMDGSFHSLPEAVPIPDQTRLRKIS